MKMKVTGTGIVSPLGRSVEEIAAHLLSESGTNAGGPDTSGGASTPAYSIGPFDPASFVTIDPNRIRALDRPTSFAFVAARNAFNAAGLNRLPPGRIGISCGIGYATTGVNAAFFSDALDHGPRMVSPLLFPLTTPSAVAGALSIFLPAAGPTLTVSAGSTSDLSAIARAAEMIEEGDADAVVAGGTGDADAVLARALSAAGLLSDRTPLPFHAEADGTALGEGAAFVVLESIDSIPVDTPLISSPRARGEDQGGGPPCRGYLAGIGEAFDRDSPIRAQTVARAVEDVLAQAGMHPEEIDGVLAGTGIRATDTAEAEAVRRVFKNRVPVISLCGMMGETFAVSNLLGALIVLECGRQGFWPASLPEPLARKALVPLTTQPTQTRGRTLLVVGTSANGHAAAALFRNGMD